MSSDNAAGMAPTLHVLARRARFGDGVGGLERAAGEHIRGLASRGWKIALYTSEPPGSIPHGVRVVIVPWRLGKPVGRSPLFGLGYAVWVAAVRRVLSQQARSGDRVYAHGAAVAAAVKKSRKFDGVRVVANPHGMEEFRHRPLSREVNRVILRRLARRARGADRVLATDLALVGPTMANLHVARQKIDVVPNFVSVDALDRVASGAIPHADEFHIVTVGRLVYNKGYDLLLAALKRPDVQQALPVGWKWTHFGVGPERGALLRVAEGAPRIELEIRSGESDAVVQRAIRASDVFIQPSRYEGSSLTTLEALAHGALCVGTSVGGIPDKITEGVTGFLAAKASVEDIGSALLRALRSQDSEVIRRNGRRLVEQKFDLPVVISQLDSILR